MEKILKTLEALKVPTLSSLDSSVPGNINTAVAAACDSVKTKKKERISYCITVTDSVCSGSIQTLGDYPKILEKVTEVLFQLCNDPDSDIRLVASDCLHRIVRTVKDQFQHRFQMEVYKEIKKNQNPRSLRLALNLFAFMSPLIRPQKCRVFMLSLLPCFAQIARRTEETLYEHLPPSFCEIFKNLGPFVNDNEVKMLCKDFISNLESSSAILRRSSASILVYICQYSRKPHVFLPKLLSQVTELLIPNLMEKSVSVIIGALLCIRQCIQPLFEQLRHNFEKKSPDQDSVVKNLIQVYEMCMILCNHDDHNVITTSLETLQQLFSSPVEQVVQRLVSPSGIQNSLDTDKWDLKTHENSQKSSSMCSLAFSDTTNLLEGDSDVPNFRSLISSTTSEIREDFDVDISITSSRRNSDLFNLDGNHEAEFGSTLEVFQPSDDEQVPNSFSLPIDNFPELHIGSLYMANVPIYYCARFLTYNFLLAGQKGHLRPDIEVRISVKVLASNCLINLISICPQIFSLPLSVDANDSESATTQTVDDILLFMKHSDPLLRGSCYILIGNLINSILSAQLEDSKELKVQVGDLIPYLDEGLRDASNIGVKCAISAINTCMIPLLRTENFLSSVTDIIQSLLIVASNSYWLVKVDIVDLLSTIEWNYIPDHRKWKKDVMKLFLGLLSDEHARVRSAVTAALVKFISLSFAVDPMTVKSVLCGQCTLKEVDQIQMEECACSSPMPAVVHQLELVLNEMLTRIDSQEDKYAVDGFYSALAILSGAFPPPNYKTVWRCGSCTDVCSLFALTIDILRSSSIVYDISIHQNVLSLACNLFLGFISNSRDDPTLSSEGNLFFHPDPALSSHGAQLVHHCLGVMKLYQSLLDCTSFSQSQSRKLSTSPVISPVKKFSQKLDSEKKTSAENDQDKKIKNIILTNSTCPNHFKKIGETLAQNWKIYKSNLDPSVTAKFTSLLITALNTLGELFDHIRSDFAGLASLIDDVLVVTYSVFYLCPIPTLRCVQKMLKCLFTLTKDEFPRNKSQRDVIYTQLNDPVEKFRIFADTYHKGLSSNRRISSAKSQSEKSALGSYIRQFEPIVVTALRMYTTSSDVMIQAEVLRLLSQLIKGHVNYGLVDKSQVFLGFVIKQIGFLEEGHIRNDGQMVEEMFEFLTLLSHEQHHSSRFIDIPKILRLCDGLVASGQNPVTHCIPALKKVVTDLFIKRNHTSYSHADKKEIEAQREVLFQMLMKLSTIPQTLPVLWLVVQGRRSWSEIKWHEDSVTVTAYLLPLLENGELQISSQSHFRSLMMLLYSVSAGSLPPIDRILQTLQDAFKLCKNTNAPEFIQWQLLVTTHWLLVVKLISSKESVFNENSCGSNFILELLNIYVEQVTSVLKSGFVGQLAMDLLTVFLQSIVTFIRLDKSPKIIEEMRSDASLELWLAVTRNVTKLTMTRPALRCEIAELLIAVLYPNVQVWAVITENSLESMRDFVTLVILKLLKALNGRESADLEEWVTSKHFKTILMHIDDQVVTTFITRLSNYRVQSLIIQLDSMLNSEVNVLMGKSILKFLERAYRNHLMDAATASIKLLRQIDEPFLILEVSQFSCFLLTMLKSDEVQVSQKNILAQILRGSGFSVSHPRLVSLLQSFDVDCDDKSGQSLLVKPYETPISEWCCGEINITEGVALAKLLSNLKYSQIISIFKLANFNLSVLGFCFSQLQNFFLKDVIDAEEVLDLFSSEKRSCHLEKWPLGVATFDFMVEMLDKWENLVDENDLNLMNEGCDAKIREISFGPHLPDMWTAAEKMLILKETVIKAGCTPRLSYRNNFIPTKIFILSFQYMKATCATASKAPVEYLKPFLSFAALVIRDSSFMRFFNVRDDPASVFVCVKSLGVVLRHIVRTFNLNFSFHECTIETWWSEMNPNCVQILTEFDRMTNFIQQVENGKLHLDWALFLSLKNLVAGLGSCDLVNVWNLISHLGWKPPTVIANQIFPPVPHVPIDILQNEKDLLLQYIRKLNLFGVSSKILFEENWMTFLSVINSYGDENSQVQIVCIGLRALSMVLKNTVKFIYIPNPGIPVPLSSKGLANLDLSLKDIEPELCKGCCLAPLLSRLKKMIDNPYEVDVNSCIRFLTDLFSQWLQNPQGKMPLLLLTEVVQCIVRMAEYFEDTYQYVWMFETLVEIFKSFEKEDEILWPHLIYGVFYAAARIPLEADAVTNLVQILDGALLSPYMNVSSAAVQSALVFLQNHPDNFPILNVITPFALKNTHLAETISDSESRSCAVWKLLLFAWIHGPNDNIGVASFEQETLSNILTVLSPLNKVYVSVRLLVLKGLQTKVQLHTLPQDAKRKIAKAALDTLKTRNVCIFFETVKLFASIFYKDFEDLYQVANPDPEALMQMAERIEILFQMLKLSNKCNALIVSKVLPHIMMDFFPPSEILNRVIAEFLNPQQHNPELLAPVVAQLFEKARRRPKEAALVREWILCSVPNFIANPDISRVSWSLTLFFIGVSTTPEVVHYLPFAELRRRSSLCKHLFIYSTMDFFSSLNKEQKEDFKRLISKGPFQPHEKNPYKFLADLIQEYDMKLG
ncbi:unnamed protein product [Allacma fusca]|uniref:Huntingtin n=1 Tax=Allacma fusca TaxID=39272 RepID=A0A8J2K403_9HEXA|nr:unnamed protein product [Allacma fusca]